MANQRINAGRHAPRASGRARTAATFVVCVGLAFSLISPHAIMVACVCGMVYGAWCLADGTWMWETRDNPAAIVNISIVIFALGSAGICAMKAEPPGELEPYLALLGAPLLGIGLRKMALQPSRIAGALAWASILGAVVAVWQVATAGQTQRASTQVSATSFGALGAIYAALCAAMSSWATETRSCKALLAMGTAAGVVVALLSGSRGAWVILALALPIAVLLGFPVISRGKIAAVFSALAAVALAVVLLPNNPTGDRIRETLRIGDPLRAAFSRESMKALVSAPWSGEKRSDFAADLDRAWLRVRPYAPHETPPQHAHNELLDAAAARGLGGLTLNILVLAVPTVVLWRLGKNEPGYGPATTGLMFMAAFLLAGTTDLLLQLTSRRMTFVFVVVFCVITATAGDSRKARIT